MHAAYPSVGAPYPVRVDATLDVPLSRWLWLVKWLLALPHYVLLFFLWIAFVVVSIVAFFAILFTGRYPPSLFEFNVGVLRWSWRVTYYSYGALGTDRYPPFTLAEVAEYPAHLAIEHPEHLSRGLVLVKWWLLALPQYVLVGVFAGGGAWVAWQGDRNALAWGPGGLIGLLVVIAAVALAFTGRYPRQIFDFVLGLNRWVLRVAAYAALMTDQYPPFRLDMGGGETGATATLPGPSAGPPAAGSPVAPAAGSPVAPAAAPLVAPATAPPVAPATAPPVAPATAPPGARWPTPPPPAAPPGQGPPGGEPPGQGWTALRVVSVVMGCLAALVSFGLLAAGGAATWLDNTQRDAAGYLTSSSHAFATSGYAITSDRIDLGSSDVVAPSAILGTVRLHVTARNPTQAVFVGIAPRASADTYLAGVGRVVVTNWANGTADYRHQSGGPPSVAPTDSSIWVASAAGKGTQTLTWRPTSGDWVVVVMHPNATSGIAITADAGATFPPLGWISAGLLTVGGILLVAGVLLIVFPVVRASRRSTATPALGP